MNLSDLNFKVKTVATLICTIISIVFAFGLFYSSVQTNTRAIEELKPQVAKIPVLESQLTTLIEGQKAILNILLQNK